MNMADEMVMVQGALPDVLIYPMFVAYRCLRVNDVSAARAW